MLADARILVVDDEPDLAENIAELLEAERATVRIVGNGAEALAAVEEGFDVVVLDVGLPDGRGVQLVNRLKDAQSSPLEVVLVTGNASIEDAIAAVETDAYAYVLKPFDPRHLLTTVARAALQVRLEREARDLAEALERREANLRALVDTVQALLVVLDEDGRVLQANPAASRTVGEPAGDIVGRHWIDEFVAPEDRTAAHAAFATCLSEGHADHEHRIVTRATADGRTAPRTHVVQWAWTSVPAEGGRRVFASGLDVTELRAYQRRAALSEKLAAVGTLAAGLAHEIRNPLNAAHLQLQLLERRAAKTDPEGRLADIARTVQGEIDRLSRLVDDFLRFARPAPLRPSPIDLSELVNHVLELERPAFDDAGARLNFEAEPEVRIEGDREKLTQLVFNLVRNAREAVGDRQGTVTVRVRPRADGAAIEVRDDGPGIPPELHDRIFEPFFSTKEGGTGLGMAICHSVVGLHGGEITARNEGGAVFEVHLPARPPG
ncbi:MAG: response regulator [Deltaproteobacteria bacterium]|nr:MAG: response regulator [Deltaproteobacteria bacterium]